MLRDVNIKGGSVTLFTFGSDESIVVFHNFLHDGKPNSRALVFGPSVQPLEQFEYALIVLGFESDPIVGNRNMDVGRISWQLSVYQRPTVDPLAVDGDRQGSAGVGKLYGIIDQIIKQLLELKDDDADLDRAVDVDLS